ncbi:MAG TPA: CocE/NonD family hydrolase [Solimonas sp.]
MKPLFRTMGLALALSLAACHDSSSVSGGAPAPVEAFGPETTTRDGYLTLTDGTRLRYHWERAVDAPPGPVVMQYDGYDAGTGGYFSNIPGVKAKLLLRGYTVLGVSVRGTGCSSGGFSLFDPQWGIDGAEAVEWAAVQPWSDGNIGMIGYSYPGIMQLFTAAQRPPHLRAIAPSNVIFDLYRDVGAPGGILNSVFSGLFTVQQQLPGAEAVPAAILQADFECAVNYAANKLAYESFVVQGILSPHIDGAFDWHSRSPAATAAQIDVPALNIVYWQDEQTGSRIGGLLEPGGLLGVLDPRKTWSVMSNGNHDLTEDQPQHSEMLLEFYERYLRGRDNGWERTPRIQILHDLRAEDSQPGWITSYDRLPSPRPVELFLREAETLALEPPTKAEAGSRYLYPLPSPSTNPLPWALSALDLLWQLPAPDSGRVVWTTPVLERDAQLLGSASADLWLTATVPDVDLQATLTEVRPDGQELYVARGWLRASARALDESRSTATRPFHHFTSGSVQTLKIGEPVLARLEIFPFAHRFRAGSALRLIVDAPTGITGDWGFLFKPLPSLNTILHDPEHASKLVVGVMDDGPAQVPAALACKELANQPCRGSTGTVPAGSLLLSE